MYWIIILFVIILILGFYKFYQDKGRDSNKSKEFTGNNDCEILAVNETFLSLMPQIESLSADVNLDEAKLSEISDKNVVARLDALVPQITNSLSNFVSNKVVENISTQIREGKIFQVIIPEGAKLYKSKELQGAYRGGYSIGGKLTGQANLVPFDITKGQNISSITNAVANVMNVSSMVVGQYYMAEINNNMEEMLESLDKVSDFQQMEFKARILALISKVGKVSKFNVEIIENDEIRKRALDNLERHEDEAVELLQQVNLSIENLITKSNNCDFDKYKEIIDEFEKLTNYQQYLLTILEEIGRLIYLLNKGSISSEQCYYSFRSYVEQSNEARYKLAKWHNENITKFKIDLQKSRLTKKGLEGFAYKIPALINEDWKYNSLSNLIVKKINKQLNDSLEVENVTDDLLDKEVRIISKNGRYYYLVE